MNAWSPAASPPGWLRVLACATFWLALWPLSLAHGQCLPIIPAPGEYLELEPNDNPSQAQPWPAQIPLLGEQTLAGDPDCFLLDGLPPELSFELLLTPDTFNPRLVLFGFSGGLWLPLHEADESGWCESERLMVTGWDPCQTLQPVERWCLQVTHSPLTPPTNGSYRAQVIPVPTAVPLGDCCQYPIPVPTGLSYTDTQNTGAAFRDLGFGPAPDVWYQLVLDQTTLLTAQTCGGLTNFDTMLRVVDDDCVTVLASNDNSSACGVGSVQSWLFTCLTAGTYYVVVEGSGTASGAFTLNLALRPSGAAASLVVGDWGRLAEEWHQHYTNGSSTLWLLADDFCDNITRVDFLGRAPDGADVLLGSDLDGWEPPLATTHEWLPPGDGWFLDFDPALLRPDPGPVCFTALLTRVDGSVQLVTTDSWYSPDLGPEELVESFEHWEIIHRGDFVVSSGPGVLPGTEISWAVGVKNLEWSRAVPPESQRGVSDTHCAPTAAGACLEWLDGTYGSNVTGGLSGDSLTRALGGYMGTNFDPANPGTKPSNMASGLQRWIDDHGSGYTVHSEIPARWAGPLRSARRRARRAAMSARSGCPSTDLCPFPSPRACPGCG